MFLQSVDRRTGTLIHLPAQGGLLDQPAKTMNVFEEMQRHFFDHMEEQINKIGKK